ncbi:uncharacterized protein LOC102801825 [Saccoglossus kowalevskii]|uniref:Uncharacterized protein LOC102801825 n=1 Tax=Saccoglossus kowalevskii TaxID=10224 RepID=A0ABM0M8Z4_SACKO|nr:PREDICTED: uncharacterized protein LOC102801825 [Saccoglossus kowalevskii]
MDVLQFCGSPTLAAQMGTIAEDGNSTDLDISIEELALTMRHHLMGDDAGQLNGGCSPILSQNNFANTIQNSYFPTDLSKSDVPSFKKTPSRSPSPQKTENSRTPSPPKYKNKTGSYIPNGHHPLKDGDSLSNYPRLRSQFYDELKKKYPKAFQRNPALNHVTDKSRVITPAKLIVKAEEKENSMPASRTPRPPVKQRTNLETARSYLNLSRQSLNFSSDDNRGTNTENDSSRQLKSRLQQNSEEMLGLLHRPDFPRYRSQDNLPSGKCATVEYRNGSKHFVHRFTSADNVSAPYTLSSRGGGYSDSPPDSAVDVGDNYSHRFSDTASADSISKSTTLPGYSLRRFSSGPIYNAASDVEYSNHREYHTADSDGDSGIGRYDAKYKRATSDVDLHAQQRSGHTPNGSRQEALKILQKKRESLQGAGLQNGHGTTRHNGPLKADHTIQAYREDRDAYSHQGARPKRAESTGALPNDYGVIQHEVLHDTPIRNDLDNHHDNHHHSNHKSQERKNRNENRNQSHDIIPDKDSNRNGLSRSPSKCSDKSGSCRSVRFEDENGPKPKPRRKTSKPKEADYFDDDVFEQPGESQRTTGSGSRTNMTSFSNPYADMELYYQDHQRRKSASRKKNVDNLYKETNGEIFSDGDYNGISHSRVSGLIQENPYEELPSRTHSRNSNRSPENIYTEVGYSNPHLDRALEESKSRTVRSHVTGKPPIGKGASRPRRSTDSQKQYSPPSSNDPRYAQVQRSQKRATPTPPPPPEFGGMATYSPRNSQDSGSLNSNPCISEHDESIVPLESDAPTLPMRGYVSDLEMYSDMTGSRTSLNSRSSVSDKIQSFGKAAKKRFHSLRRAVSLDRLDNKGHRSDQIYDTPKMKKSPSLRSLTSRIGRRKESDYDSFYQNERMKQEKKMQQRPGSARSDRSISSRKSTTSSVTSPNHLRKVGRILKSNVDGTLIIELVKPPSGPFGFYIARGNEKFGRGIFISRMSDGYPEKMFAGLMGIGDEILEINGTSLVKKTLDDVYDAMADRDRLVLKIMPLLSRKDW